MRRNYLALGLVLGFILVFSMIFISFVSAQSTHTCSDPSQTIMKLYEATNSHGALWNDIIYGYEICYNEIFGSTYTGVNPHACAGSNKILGLSAITNAHGEIPSLNNYAIDVCYGNLVCAARSSCLQDEEIVVSLFSDTNSHISAGDDLSYNVKICCKPAEPGIEIRLDKANWTNINDIEIINAKVWDVVRLVVEGIPENETVNFEIYEDDVTGDNLIKTGLSGVIGTNGTGKIIIEYNITQEDYDAGQGGLEGDREEFYFIATSSTNNNIFIQSPILYVYPADVCACTDGTLCGSCAGYGALYCPDDADGQDPVEFCGLTQGENCGLCPSGYDCVIDTWECIEVSETIICEDYKNQTDCENDLEEVAVYTWETEYEHEGECSDYSEGNCDYDVTCVCEWNGTDCGGERDSIKDCAGEDPISGSCGVLPNIISDCVEDPPGFRIINLTYVYEGDGTCEDFDCCGSKVFEKKCLARIMVQFFDILNLIIAIVLIIIFYIVVLKKKKKYRKKKIKLK